MLAWSKCSECSDGPWNSWSGKVEDDTIGRYLHLTKIHLGTQTIDS